MVVSYFLTFIFHDDSFRISVGCLGFNLLLVMRSNVLVLQSISLCVGQEMRPLVEVFLRFRDLLHFYLFLCLLATSTAASAAAALALEFPELIGLCLKLHFLLNISNLFELYSCSLSVMTLSGMPYLAKFVFELVYDNLRRGIRHKVYFKAITIVINSYEIISAVYRKYV